MNRRAFDAILRRVATGNELSRIEIESVVADCSRLREMISTFCTLCSEGTSKTEVGRFFLTLDGAPYDGHERRKVTKLPGLQ